MTVDGVAIEFFVERNFRRFDSDSSKLLGESMINYLRLQVDIVVVVGRAQ
jgi:hypothetical protein